MADIMAEAQQSWDWSTGAKCAIMIMVTVMPAPAPGKQDQSREPDHVRLTLASSGGKAWQAGCSGYVAHRFSDIVKICDQYLDPAEFRPNLFQWKQQAPDRRPQLLAASLVSAIQRVADQTSR